VKTEPSGYSYISHDAEKLFKVATLFVFCVYSAFSIQES